MSRKQRRAAAARQQPRPQVQAQPRPVSSASGPITPEGKAISSQNAFSHGLTAARLVLPWENQGEFDSLLNQLVAEHKPATATEGILVREMAEQYWRLQRARNREYGLLRQEDRILTQSETEPSVYDAWSKQVNLTQRYCTRHERAFHKCLSTLRSLQKERRQAESETSDAPAVAASQLPVEAASEFVSQNAETPAIATSFASVSHARSAHPLS